MTRSFHFAVKWKGVLRPGCGTGLAAIISGDHSLVSSIPSQMIYDVLNTASLIIVLRVTITTHTHNSQAWGTSRIHA